MQGYIFNTIAGVMKTRKLASVVAFLILLWLTIQCFTALICAINRACGTEVKNWRRLPLKSLLLDITAVAALLCIALPKSGSPPCAPRLCCRQPKVCL